MIDLIADMTLAEVLGQVCGLVALGFCIAGFANKNDDRLMVLLISANVAFALMFAFFESWTASALTVLLISASGAFLGRAGSACSSWRLASRWCGSRIVILIKKNTPG